MRRYAAAKRKAARKAMALELMELTRTTATEGKLRTIAADHRANIQQAAPGTPYTEQQLDWLRASYPLLSLVDLVEQYNQRYPRAQRSKKSIHAAIKNHGIRSGRTGRFEPGQVSWNKGRKGFMGPNATSFKSGNMPHNKRRLWSERTSKDGYIEISVPERNPHTGAATRYRLKHVWLWEHHHGPVPQAHAVIFLDGNAQNVTIENLALVHRNEALSMNLHGYKAAPPEVKTTIMALAKLEAKAGFRLRPGRGRQGRSA